MPTILYRNKAGKRVKGTTTIISQNIGWGKGGLLYWANQQGLDGKTLDEARDTATVPGTIAHYMIECHLKGIPLNVDGFSGEDIRKAQAAYENFLEWTEQFKFKPIAIEPNLVSEKWQYGFTPDLIAWVQGVRSLTDWKTGKIYANTLLQLAAYKAGWEELHPDQPIKRIDCLRIPRNEDVPSFHHSFWKDLPDTAWQSFEYALKLSDNEKELKKLL